MNAVNLDIAITPSTFSNPNTIPASATPPTFSNQNPVSPPAAPTFSNPEPASSPTPPTFSNPQPVSPPTFSNPDAVSETRMGRPLRVLSDEQREAFFKVIRSGGGKVQACREADVSYKTFLRLVRDDEDFAAELWAAETELVEACEAVIYRTAMNASNPSLQFRASMAYIKRKEKQAERMSRAQLEAREREVKRREQDVEQALAIIEEMSRETKKPQPIQPPARPKVPPIGQHGHKAARR
jgi:hypothetical protein